MKEANEIIELINGSENIIITSHRSPDGDSIGSTLGLYRFIKKLGRNVTMCHPDDCPSFLEWVKGGDVILDFESDEEKVTELMLNADLIFCLDYNGANRLGNAMGTVLVQSEAIKIMIDHHPNPDDFVTIAVSETEVCSTSQLIFELIDSSGNLEMLDAAIGTPLYLGIVTDTGSFRYPSVQSRTHVIVAKLLDAGVNHSEVHERTFDDNRLDKIKLRAHVLAERLELLEGYPIAIISVTEQDMTKFHYVKGDTEGLVNVALSVEGVEAAAFFAEKDGVVKISFRSKGNVYVNELAHEHFAGGGHKYAAGGISEASLSETINKFKDLVPKYF